MLPRNVPGQRLFVLGSYALASFPARPVIFRQNWRRFSRRSRRSPRSRAPTPYTNYRINPLTSMMNTVEAHRRPEAFMFMLSRPSSLVMLWITMA